MASLDSDEPTSFDIPQFSPMDDVATRLTFDDIPVDADEVAAGPPAGPLAFPSGSTPVGLQSARKSAFGNAANAANENAGRAAASGNGARPLKSALKSSSKQQFPQYRVSTPLTVSGPEPAAVARAAAFQQAPPRHHADLVPTQYGGMLSQRRATAGSEEEQLWQRFREAGVDEVAVLKKERDALVDKVKLLEDQVRESVLPLFSSEVGHTSRADRVSFEILSL